MVMINPKLDPPASPPQSTDAPASPPQSTDSAPVNKSNNRNQRRSAPQDKSSGKLPIFPYGDMNPVFKNKVSSSPYLDISNRDPIAVALELAYRANIKDSRDGTGPYRGIVLRVENEIIGDSSNPLPVTAWLARFFKSDISDIGGKKDKAPAMPENLDRYKVYIPELHVGIPKPDNFVLKSNPPAKEDYQDHIRIDRFHTFIAKDVNTSSAVAGQLVWVDFGNVINFEDPIYLGPVFDNANPPEPGFPHGRDQWNCPLGRQVATPKGVPLSKHSYRKTANKDTGKRLKEHIAEYRAQFGVGLEKISSGLPWGSDDGCHRGDGVHRCMYHLQEFNDTGPNPGNVQGLANSTFMSTRVHPPGSSHYEGTAIDIPARISDSTDKSDRIALFWEARGYAVKWRASDHYDHVHVDWRPGKKGQGQRMIETPPTEEVPTGDTGSLDRTKCN